MMYDIKYVYYIIIIQDSVFYALLCFLFYDFRLR